MVHISNNRHKCTFEGIWHPNGEKYIGKLFFEDGRIFYGEVSETIEPKEGKMYFINGSEYDGTFTGGWCNKDVGTQKYKNGDVYVGTFLQGRKKKGRMTYAGGYSYIGTWNNDEWNVGTLIVDGDEFAVNKKTTQKE